MTLSGLRGSDVLLAFFPLAFTRVCPTELRAFLKANERISVDQLSDCKRDVSRSRGTRVGDVFHSKRAYILIDRDGAVR